MQPRSSLGPHRAFDRHAVRLRAFALLLAAVLTLGPLLALQVGRAPRDPLSSAAPVAYLSLRLPPAKPVDKTEVPPRAPSRPRRVDLGPGVPAEAPIAMPPTITEELPTVKASEAAAPQADLAAARQQPASSPIQLDASTIRSAVRASRSELRKMAEASGAHLGPAPVPGSQALAMAIAETAKEDCVAPDAGGSLLSVFIIPYKAIRGQCKWR